MKWKHLRGRAAGSTRVLYFGVLVVLSATIVLLSKKADMLSAVSETHSRSVHINRGSRINDHFLLQRSTTSLALEAQLDGGGLLGACQAGGVPRLAGLPERACKPLLCLWSTMQNANVDLWLHTLSGIHDAALKSKCPTPLGGQTPVEPGQVPEVAFVMTVANHSTIAAQALVELFRTSHEVPSAEYIVVDDGSREQGQEGGVLLATIGRLRSYFGVEVKYKQLRHAEGYGAASQIGIAMATAKYVVLVNSDAFVGRGWLYSLWDTFRTRPGVGMVGPLMIGEGGLVTEAGGIIWRDTGAANYARGRGHQAREVSFSRKVDYISAACVMFPRQLYSAVGGFDSAYGLGYYEDTDLAMQVREKGLEVVFQPLSVVYHQEGTTLGTDGSPLKQRLMARNGELFHKKWQKQLQAQYCPSTTPLDVAALRQAVPRALWVDDIVPEVDRDSGSVRSSWMLRILLDAGYYVAFQPRFIREDRYIQQMRYYGVDVLPVTPASTWRLVNDNNSCKYDIIFISRPGVYEESWPTIAKACPQAPLVYDTVDLHFLREARQKLSTAVQGNWNLGKITTAAIKNWLDTPEAVANGLAARRDAELAVIRNANITFVVSHDETELLKQYCPTCNIAIISNIHDFSPANTSCVGRSGIMFVGNFNHLPNQQAVTNLIEYIVPLIKALLPSQMARDFKLHVVGSNLVPVAIQELAAKHRDTVVLHGWLSDELLRVLYSRVKVVVAPLLSGAGVKGKVNQAMKLGVPVVATGVAVEGMHVTDGKECMVADSPGEFARKVAHVYTSCDLWQSLASEAFANVEKWFSVDTAKEQMMLSLGQLQAHRQAMLATTKRC